MFTLHYLLCCSNKSWVPCVSSEVMQRFMNEGQVSVISATMGNIYTSWPWVEFCMNMFNISENNDQKYEDLWKLILFHFLKVHNSLKIQCVRHLPVRLICWVNIHYQLYIFVCRVKYFKHLKRHHFSWPDLLEQSIPVRVLSMFMWYKVTSSDVEIHGNKRLKWCKCQFLYICLGMSLMSRFRWLLRQHGAGLQHAPH